MTMMKAMGVVVTEYTSVVTLENLVVDVGKVVACYLAVTIHPYLATQNAISMRL
jgi:hypothetical protein